MRGSFDPKAVKREHISPKVFLYGDDAPGISLRVDRFIEVLRESGESPSVFRSARDAFGYLLSGDMFSDSVRVVITDASDIMKSDSESSRMRKELFGAVSSYGDDSCIIIATNAKPDSNAVKDSIERMNGMGAMVRAVMSPKGSGASKTWLESYLSSCGLRMLDETKEKVLVASDGDIDAMRDIIDAIGYELSGLSVVEIRKWMDDEQKVSASDVRAAVATGDIVFLRERVGLGSSSPSDHRMALMKIRSALLDLLLASLAHGKAEGPLFDFKVAQYGNGNSAYFIVKDNVGDSRVPPYMKAYQKVNDEIESLSSSRASDSLSVFASLSSLGVK